MSERCALCRGRRALGPAGRCASCALEGEQRDGIDAARAAWREELESPVRLASGLREPPAFTGTPAFVAAALREWTALVAAFETTKSA